MQITSNPPTVAAIPTYIHIRLQKVADYIYSLTDKPGVYTRGPWRIVVTNGFHNYHQTDLYALQSQLKLRHLPPVAIDVFPADALENPMPPNWSTYEKDRTVWVYRGQRAVGYVRI